MSDEWRANLDLIDRLAIAEQQARQATAKLHKAESALATERAAREKAEAARDEAGKIMSNLSLSLALESAARERAEKAAQELAEYVVALIQRNADPAASGAGRYTTGLGPVPNQRPVNLVVITSKPDANLPAVPEPEGGEA